MERVKVNGVELEYEVRGSGEPVLLIDMLIADCFVPLLTEPSLADHYQLIRYHKRGWVGSTHTPPPVTIGDHAADAAALLDRLGVQRAHVVGHSTGATIAAQLALDTAAKVHTLVLLEPTLVSLPLGQAFLRSAEPIFEAYGNGDHAGAFAVFAAAASGLEWEACRALLEKRIPGVVAQSISDADTFFGVELPSLPTWIFGPEEAAAVRQPVLSVLGAETQPLWVEIAAFLARRSRPWRTARSKEQVISSRSSGRSLSLARLRPSWVGTPSHQGRRIRRVDRHGWRLERSPRGADRRLAPRSAVLHGGGDPPFELVELPLAHASRSCVRTRSRMAAPRRSRSSRPRPSAVRSASACSSTSNGSTPSTHSPSSSNAPA